MATSDGIDFEEELEGVGDGLALGKELLRYSLFEDERKVFRCIRCLLRINRELKQIFRWRDVRIFRDA